MGVTAKGHMKNILLLAGAPGVGKSAVAQILRREFSIRVSNVGDLLAKHLAARNITVASRADIGPTFFRHYSSSDVYSILFASIEQNTDNVFDGVRLFDTCSRMRNAFPFTKIWLIGCREDLRVNRLNSRISKSNMKNCIAADMIEKYSQIKSQDYEIQKIADLFLENNSTITDLEANAIHHYRLITTGSL